MAKSNKELFLLDWDAIRPKKTKRRVCRAAKVTTEYANPKIWKWKDIPDIVKAELQKATSKASGGSVKLIARKKKKHGEKAKKAKRR